MSEDTNRTHETRPRRTKLLRMIIHSVYRPPLIRTNDDIRPLDTRQRILHLPRQERLPLPPHTRHVQPGPIHHRIDQRGPAQRAHDNRGLRPGAGAELGGSRDVAQDGGDACYGVDVGLEVGRGAVDA